MSQIQLLKSGNQAFDLWQTRVKSQLDPVLANKIMQGNLLQGLTLTPGVNNINHLLGRTPYGWFPVDVNAPWNIWRSGPLNAQTLILTSSNTATLTVSLWVF